jgi:hypothetical protein
MEIFYLLYQGNKVSILDVSSKPQRFQTNGPVKIWVYKSNATTIMGLIDSCPHRGFQLNAHNSGFVCVGHGWEFNLEGKNLNNKSLDLSEIELLFDKHGYIFFRLDSSPICDPSNYDQFNSRGAQTQYDISKYSFTLHSHATLEIRNDSEMKSIIFDPWFKGRAFMNSWFLYPPPIEDQKLSNFEIIITHEHSDHLNIDTLLDFDKDILIHIPNFQSGRIQNRLRNLGFKNLNIINLNKKFTIDSIDAELEFLRPSSLWEDSILYLQSNEFNLLSVNDAGYLGDIHKLPRNIDILASAFDQGASDWPACWSNVKTNRISSIYANGKKNLLNHIGMMCKTFDCKYFLPYAGYWRHLNDKHQVYADSIVHTNHVDIRKTFVDLQLETEIIDILPGESWDFVNRRRNSRTDRNLLFTPEHIEKCRKDSLGKTKGIVISEPNLAATKSRLREHLVTLNNKAQIFDVENVVFKIEVYSAKSEYLFTESMDFVGEGSATSVKLTVEVPIDKLEQLLEYDLSWDELRIGYWAKWNRIPDIGTPNFFLLLQSSGTFFENKVIEKIHYGLNFNENVSNISISKLISEKPDEVQQIFSTFNLPCLTCSKVGQETIGKVFEIHKTPTKIQNIILNKINGLINQI